MLKKKYSYWNADEEKYSMRLKEDRKLRKEGWEVFRVSNWEIGKEDFLPDILEDLLNYFGIYLPLAIEQSVTDDSDISSEWLFDSIYKPLN